MTVRTAASTSPATAQARATRARLIRATRSAELQRRLTIARTLRAA